MKYNWKPVVNHLLNHLEAAGFPLVEASDGDEIKKSPERAEALEMLTACDEGHAYFYDSGRTDKPIWAFLVFGNEPHELVSDYTARDSEDGKRFDAAITAWSEMWEGHSCPLAGEKGIRPDLVPIFEALQKCTAALRKGHNALVDYEATQIKA